MLRRLALPLVSIAGLALAAVAIQRIGVSRVGHALLSVNLAWAAAALFLMIGADPCTTWLHDIGVDLDAKGFVCTHDSFATSIPGLFAVGDVRANSVKRVASAVGEGSVVISAVHAYLASRRTF